MKHDPVDIIYLLADFLRTKREGEEVILSEIARHTKLHRLTVKKYLKIIKLVHERLPHVETENGRVRITRLAADLAELDESEVLLASLYFKKAINEKGAITPEPWMRTEAVERLVSRQFLEKTGDGRIFLSPLGLMTAMLIIRDKISGNLDASVMNISEPHLPEEIDEIPPVRISFCPEVEKSRRIRLTASA